MLPKGYLATIPYASMPGWVGKEGEGNRHLEAAKFPCSSLHSSQETHSPPFMRASVHA